MDIADEVKSFYDRYPYPRPVDSLEQYARLWDDQLKRRAEHHLFWPDKPYRDDHTILIAGCGTSQAAKHALRWPKAQVIGVDRGTMVRHSGIVYRNDGPPGTHPISFAGNEWLRYVPIRMSDTVCVQGQLTTGPATVLINRTHSYTDLLMAVDSAEKRLFEAIDGSSTIADILSRSFSAPEQFRRDRARTFFERLWWHDQVVFDSTQSLSSPMQFGETRKD